MCLHYVPFSSIEQSEILMVFSFLLVSLIPKEELLLLLSSASTVSESSINKHIRRIIQQDETTF